MKVIKLDLLKTSSKNLNKNTRNYNMINYFKKRKAQKEKEKQEVIQKAKQVAELLDRLYVMCEDDVTEVVVTESNMTDYFYFGVNGYQYRFSKHTACCGTGWVYRLNIAFENTTNYTAFKITTDQYKRFYHQTPDGEQEAEKQSQIDYIKNNLDKLP